MARKVNAKLVLVMCGSRVEARKIAHAVVQRRLAACVNVISSPVESIYRWNGKVESAKEFLLVIKTASRAQKQLEQMIARLHSYEVPEFLVIQVDSGSEQYLNWLIENASATAKLEPRLEPR
jgi:periplasmic divalent cation tolerance protein